MDPSRRLNRLAALASTNSSLWLVMQLVVPEGDGVMVLMAAELVEAEADGAAAAELLAARETKEDERRAKHRTRKDDKRAKRRARLDAARARKRAR
jgi:hypothetical protein